MKSAIYAAVPLLFAGCAAHYGPGAEGDPYGFLAGLWHGLVCPYAILANLVSWLCGLFGFELWRSIEIIGRPNSGFLYYVGFLLGFLPYKGAY